jgi:hypothetical protein
MEQLIADKKVVVWQNEVGTADQFEKTCLGN